MRVGGVGAARGVWAGDDISRSIIFDLGVYLLDRTRIIIIRG